MVNLYTILYEPVREVKKLCDPQGVRKEKIVPLAVVAVQLGLSPRTVEDRRWRRRAQLPVVKIAGHVVGVAQADLDAALRRGREQLHNGDGAA